MTNEKPKTKTCPRCGGDLSYFHTNRYLEGGEAVCDCKCGQRICSSADWKNKNGKS